MKSSKILIVEDEALSAKYFADLVGLMGHDVCGIVATADDAIDLALTHRPDIVLMDVRLKGDKDGIEAARVIHIHLPTKVICITASTDRFTMERIRDVHPFGILTKPVLTTDLEQSIALALN